jgi:hypothetical protein
MNSTKRHLEDGQWNSHMHKNYLSFHVKGSNDSHRKETEAYSQQIYYGFFSYQLKIIHFMPISELKGSKTGLAVSF